jgi:hypothetical protein
MRRGAGSTPRDAVRRLEAAPVLPAGPGERFAGYGLTGVTFASGHVLALRRFSASSIGPAYGSVWHRNPEGRWTFYSDVESDLACGRYFGSAGSCGVREEIAITWTGEQSFSVCVPSLGLAWAVQLEQTRATRLLSTVVPRLPRALWGSAAIRRGLAAAAARSLKIGRLALDGLTPLRQRFSLQPQRVWIVGASVARIHGEHLGPPVLPHEQERLGDFWIPRWGLFMVGHARFVSVDTSSVALAPSIMPVAGIPTDHPHVRPKLHPT